MVRLVVNWGLFLSSIVMVTTGLMAYWWGLSQMSLHVWSGFVFAALAVVHTFIYMPRLLRWPRRVERAPQKKLERPKPQPRWRVVSPTRRAFLRGLLAGGAGMFGAMTLSALAFFGRSRAKEADLGQAYHRWSSVTLRGVLWGMLPWGKPMSPFKTYPDAPRHVLPPSAPMPVRLDEALNRRRSVRDYADTPISLEALSALLHAAQGITEPSFPKRAAPSAGALYPLEVYVSAQRVAGLAPGLYHYAVREHALERLKDDVRRPLTVACLDQEHVPTAAAVFVLTAIFQRERWKYKGRAYRYILMEAGHVGQNIYLAATALGLGACAIGAFYDDLLNELLGVDGEEEAALYVLTVGVPQTP